MPEDKKQYVNREGVSRPLKSPIRPEIVETVRQYRLKRLRDQLSQTDCVGILLYDPVNIRYATDSSNMQVWVLHNAARYCLLLNEGPCILFEIKGCAHLADQLSTVDEVRESVSWFYFIAGEKIEDNVKIWADEIHSLLVQHGGGNKRLAVDKLEPEGTFALADLGVEIVPGQKIAEQARSIKSSEELQLIDWTIKVTESGIWRMHERSTAGHTENEIWAELHFENIRNGGEWIETRLLSSGPRTNPWFQESSDREVKSGEILTFDTDLIGPYGYCADVSRAWTIDQTTPTSEQKRLYNFARDQVLHNMSVVKPGMTFSEFNEKSWKIPDEFIDQRYGLAIHGVGLCDEWPAIPNHPDFGPNDEGRFSENMVICVESYVGAVGGREGIKLETQCLLTDAGLTHMETFPFEDW